MRERGSKELCKKHLQKACVFCDYEQDIEDLTFIINKQNNWLEDAIATFKETKAVELNRKEVIKVLEYIRFESVIKDEPQLKNWRFEATTTIGEEGKKA